MGQCITLKNAPLKSTVVFTRVIEDDEYAAAPDKNDEGFWPSLDKDAPGYIGAGNEAEFQKQLDAAHARMAAWNEGVWNYVGVRAKAVMSIPIGVRDVCTYTLKSAGLWGIESDSAESYFNEVFADQKAELLSHIILMGEVEEVD